MFCGRVVLTYVILLVRLEEELLQQLGPEFVEDFFEVDVGASVVVPQIRVELGENLGIQRVQRAPVRSERLLQ